MRPESTPLTPAQRLLARLEADLSAAERELEAPEFEELVGAAEGRLDEAGRALWEERVARSPELARRAADLRRFGAEAYPVSGRVVELPSARRRETAPWLGWAAAAAAALVVVVLRAGGPADDARVELRRATPAATELVFADGFEHGDPSSWSTVSPSG